MRQVVVCTALGLLWTALLACTPAASPAGSARPAAPAPAAGAPAAASAPSTAGSPAAAPLTPIKISNPSPAMSILPFYVAVDHGFFQQQGLDATIVQLPGRAAQTALEKGEIDFMNSPSDAIIAATNGFPFKVVYLAWDAAPWTVIGKTELRSIPDLRGRIVAVNRPGSSPYAYFEAGVKRAGLATSDLNLLHPAGTQDNYAALIAGQIDAAVVSPPFDAQAAEQGFHEVEFLGNLLEIPYIGLSATEGYIQRQRKEVLAAIRAMIQAGDFIRTQPEPSIDLIVKYIGVTRPVAERSYQRMVPLLSKTGEASAEGFRQSIVVQASVSNTEITLEPDSVVDWSLLREVRAGR